MQKMIRMFALLLVVAMLFCACGTAEETSVETEPTAPLIAEAAKSM